MVSVECWYVSQLPLLVCVVAALQGDAGVASAQAAAAGESAATAGQFTAL